MAKRTSNQIGADLEERARAVLDGQKVKQSGGGKFWKSDVRDGRRFIWSCKATAGTGFRVTKELLRESQRAARGMVGTGDDYRAGMVVEVDGTAYVVLSLEDFADILTAEPEVLIQPSKAASRLAKARASPSQRL